VGKRLFDIVVATVMLVLTLPLMVVLALAVALSLRTWRPLFFQERVGRGGRRFILPKLRTLPTSAPRYADKYALASVPTTRLGRFLRSTHLDELPQLALVVLGRMSLIGPRPEMACLLEELPEPFVAARLLVRPGCTGLWQVSCDAGKLIGEVPHHDLYYIAHANPRLDVWILGQTLLTLASGAGRASSIPAWAAPGRPGPPGSRATRRARPPRPGPFGVPGPAGALSGTVPTASTRRTGRREDRRRGVPAEVGLKPG